MNCTYTFNRYFGSWQLVILLSPVLCLGLTVLIGMSHPMLTKIRIRSHDFSQQLVPYQYTSFSFIRYLFVLAWCNVLCTQCCGTGTAGIETSCLRGIGTRSGMHSRFYFVSRSGFGSGDPIKWNDKNLKSKKNPKIRWQRSGHQCCFQH